MSVTSMSALDNTLRKGLNTSVFANTFIVTGPSNLQFLTAQTIFSGIYLKIAWSGGAGVLSKSQQMKVLFCWDLISTPIHQSQIYQSSKWYNINFFGVNISGKIMLKPCSCILIKFTSLFT
jgi:hypothetical protein